MTKQPLELEVRDEENRTLSVGSVSLTPSIDEDYWQYRVRITDKQSVVGFPKFSTIGIGFAVEDDWNTNLPYTCKTAEIVDHIFHNAGDRAITRDVVAHAVSLIQQRAKADRTHPRPEYWYSATLAEQFDHGRNGLIMRESGGALLRHEERGWYIFHGEMPSDAVRLVPESDEDNG